MDKQVQAVVQLEGLDKPITPISQISIMQQMGNHMTFSVGFPIEILERSGASFGQQSRQALGKLLTMSFSYSTESAKSNIFKGLITDVYTAKYKQRGDEIVVSGASPTVLLEGAPKCRTFADKTLKQVLDIVLSDYPDILKPLIRPKHTQSIPYLTQYFENDFTFIVRLAIHYGEACFWDGERFIFGEMQAGKAIPLQLVKNLKHFEMTQSVATSAYRIKGYNPINNQIFESTSSEISTPNLGNHADYACAISDKLMDREGLVPSIHPFQYSNQLKEYVTTRRMQDLNDLIKFNASSDSPYLNLGREVDILANKKTPQSNGLEQIGKYSIIGLSISMDSSGNYSSIFEGEPSGSNLPPARTGVRHPVCQAQTAIVKDNNDPEGLGRVRVQLRWQQKAEMTPWIRVILPYAGAQSKGFYFIPEIGDEVFVDFEHHNPDLPFVIGSTYNGGQKPVSWVDGKNNYKAIQTRSGNLISLYDEKGSEAIRITNANSESMLQLSFAGDGMITLVTNGELHFEWQEGDGF